MTRIFLKIFFIILLIFSFFLLMKEKIEAFPLCECVSDLDCNGWCPVPGTPSFSDWSVYNETQLCGVINQGSPTSDYYHLTGSADFNFFPPSFCHSNLNPGTYYSYQVQGCRTNCIECQPGGCDILPDPPYYSGICVVGPDVCGNYSSSFGRYTEFYPPSSLDKYCYASGNTANAYLTWYDNSSAESGYKIEMKYSGEGYFYEIASTGANTGNYTVTGLLQGAGVYFRVRAYHNSGTYSSYSNEVYCVTPISAPSNLVATAVSSSQINLSWEDNSIGESGFKIYRATGSCSNFSYINSVGANITSFSDTGLAQGTTYCYYVTAYTINTESNASNQASATTFLPAPSNLNANGISPSQINLSWTDNSTGESGFKIERGDYTCSGFLQIGTAPANSTTYSDSGLNQCTAYCYRVRAYTNYTNSSYSNNAIGTTTVAIPSNLMATPDSTIVNLSWTDNSNNESGFKIRSEEGNNCGASSPVVGTVGQNVTSFQHSGLKNGWQYCYLVCAYSDYCGEGCSSSVTAITSLPAPSNLFFSSVGTNGFVLTWTDNSNSESGFKIEEKVGSSGSWTEIGTVNANITTFTRSGLSCSGSSSNQYYYRVRAYTSYANSSYSNEIGPKSPLPCPASNLSANIVGPNQVNLSWSDNSSNESGFKIERKAGSTGSYQVIDIVNANVTSYSDTTAQDGTNYYYRVRAYNSDGDSDASNEVSATTPLPAPSNLQCNAVSSSQINLSWSDNSLNEASFKIERKVSGGNYSEIATVGQNTTNYANVNLPENTTYYYRVKAANSNTESNYSNEVYCTTLIYVPTGYLISSIFDTGISQGVAFNSLIWYGTLPATAHVRFQFASSNCQNGADNPPSCDINTGWEDNFKGPDGTSATYYEPAGPTTSIPLKTFYHNNHRYFRYKVFLYPNEDRTQTPVIQRVIINYSP